MQKKLRIDFGGTKIKIACFSDTDDIADINKTAIYYMDSFAWQHEQIYNLVNKSLWYGIQNRFKLWDFDSISLCGPFVTDSFGNITSSWLLEQKSVPKDFVFKMQEVSGKVVKVINDGMAWVRGAAFVNKKASLGIDYPLMLFSLGTGVGVGYCEIKNNSFKFETHEISSLLSSFPETKEASGRHDLSEAWQIHHIIGKEFFKWISDNNLNWNFEKIRYEYTKRLLAVLRDLSLNNAFNINNVQTIVFSGGSVWYISASQLRQSDFFAHRKLFIFRDDFTGLKPDIVPLIGL
jgi:hypothetical protein